MKGMIRMAECECLEQCPFFNDRMASKPATSEMFKKAYCRGDNNRCARYMVFSALGGAAVPADLFPNQVERARDVINAAAVD